MPTERRLPAVLGLALLAALAPAGAAAQISVDGQTEVRSIRFQGAHSLSDRELRAVLVTRDRGRGYWLRNAVGKLPFVPPPERHPFSPLELQRDVVRLRGKYSSSGFLRAQVRYDVRREEKRNLLDVTFVVDEGPPVLIDEVTITGPDSLAPLPVPESERKDWTRIERWAEGMRGRRLDVGEARAGRERITRWWQNRGFARARVEGKLDQDTTRGEGRILYRVHAGDPARFGDIHVEGNVHFSDRAVTREMPFRPGDRYSAAELDQARQDAQQLDIVRVALVDVPSLAAADSAGPAPRDSVLAVRVRITEAEPRLVSGEVGYITDAGFSTEARWTHRNFGGEARTLTVTGVAQTGWLALDDNPDEIYRASVSLQQPYVFRRHLGAILTPFVEHRDDVHDRSLNYGLNTTLVYRLAPLRNVSFGYEIGRRRIYEYRLEDLTTGEIDLLTFLTQASKGFLDSLGATLKTSVFTLSGNTGSVDNQANPHRGVLFRPVLKLAGPEAITSLSYSRADAVAYGFAPLGRSVVLATRFALGGLFPFGQSLPSAGEDPRIKFLQLSDVTFTAGGTGDVRGWENRLLGPKLPDIRLHQSGDSLVAEADGYVPVGGFARAAVSVELRLPLPALGPKFGSHVFLDGGRVWTEDDRFGAVSDNLDQERMFWATGAGFDLITPVGPIRLGVGYKLNPSIPDLVDSDDLLRAQEQGLPYESLEKHQSRRWQFYFAIGSSF